MTTILEYTGTYKGCDIQIEREWDGRFYIIVTHQDGGHLYDGWWGCLHNTRLEAIKEAILGAGLGKKP